MNPRVEIERQRLRDQARPVPKGRAIAKLGDYNNLTGLNQAIQPNGGITYGTNLSNVAQSGDLMRVVQAPGGLAALDNLSISSAQIVRGVGSISRSDQNQVFPDNAFSAINGDVFSKGESKRKIKTFPDGNSVEIDDYIRLDQRIDARNGAILFNRPIKSDFVLTFDYLILEEPSDPPFSIAKGNGLSVSLTEEFGTNNSIFGTLGVKEGIVDMFSGEFAAGIDQFDNGDFASIANRPMVFILTDTSGRTFVDSGFAKTWIDIPTVSSTKVQDLVDVVGATVYKQASVSLFNGVITANFNGVEISSPMIGDPIGNFLKITAASTPELIYASTYQVKNVVLQKI